MDVKDNTLGKTSLGGQVVVDWSRCCICQCNSQEKLLCPARNPVEKTRNSGYENFSKSVKTLIPFSYVLPSRMPINIFGDGESILDALIKNEAKWHKSCIRKFLEPRLTALIKKLDIDPTSEKAEETTKGSGNKNTRSKVTFAVPQNQLCFLCKKPESNIQALHRCETKQIHERVLDSAKILENSELLAMLNSGDLVALEAKYHKECLVDLYYRARRCKTSQDGDNATNLCEGIAFSNLLIYIQGKLEESGGDYIFKMIDIVKMYTQHLSDLVGEIKNMEHTTRLREKIQIHFPELKAEKVGRNYILRHEKNKDFSNINDDQELDALAFHRFAKNLRTEISKCDITFKGSFPSGCQEQCIPPPLLATINTILYGTTESPCSGASQPAVTICQLILFNFKNNAPRSRLKTQNIRHKKSVEPPLPLYMALSTYGQSRNKAGIDEMHQRGLSISHDRVMEITSNLAHMVVERAKDEGVLCPGNLKKDLFTVVAYDNIDHNPSSVTSTNSFHGSGLSVFQLCTSTNSGTERSLKSYEDFAVTGRRSVPLLPDFYGFVPETLLKTKQPSMRLCEKEIGANMLNQDTIKDQWKQEQFWLGHLQRYMTGVENDQILDATWAGYHATNSNVTLGPVAINSILPLFHENSASVSMVKHAMNLAVNLTVYLNSNQVPIFCADQPLYALVKLVQWNWPDLYSERQFVALFAPFHIEQSFLRVIGQFMDGSGWLTVIVNSGIITEGSAEAILKVTHVTKARHVHEITASTLYSLLQDAFLKFSSESQTFEEWINESREKSPTFLYWLTLLNLEILYLCFVRSLRVGDFSLFIESVKKMMPWFFVFNHSNYSRWLSVHIKDLEELPVLAPMVHKEFVAGNFVVRKTKRPFSALAVDQAHEQNNAIIKSQGGAIGLTQDPSSLRRFTIAGPEVSRLLQEFEHHNDINDSENDTRHHEQYTAYQKKYINKCLSLKESFLQSGNPFEELGEDLIAIDTRTIIDNSGVACLKEIEQTGVEMYTSFINDRLVNKTKSIYEPIKKQNSKVFLVPKTKKTENENKKQSNVQLFSRLFIVSESRKLNMDDFFRYENQEFPPSISLNGGLRSGNKSNLVEILEKIVLVETTNPKHCDGIVCDGAAMTHLVVPRVAKTFQEYFHLEFYPYIKSKTSSLNCKRVDVVWDLYNTDTIKKAREKRGTGVRRQVLAKGVLPKKWSDFLGNSDNKSELFAFLAKNLVQTEDDLEILTNVGDILATKNCESALAGKSCLKWEEADGRILLHVSDMVRLGAKNILVQTVDTDVVVLCVSFFYELQAMGLEELWVLFGSGKNRRYIAAYKIAIQLGRERCMGLRGFHAFTGCDSVSFFGGKGKKGAWKTWMSCESATDAFIFMSFPNDHIPSHIQALLEDFTSKMYVSTTEFSKVDQLRKHLFCTENKPLHLIPPSSAALLQHCLRAAYQAGQIWGRSLDMLHCDPPAPISWGWVQHNEVWEPVWSTLSSIWTACRELEKCGCKSGCDSQRCSCRRAGLTCTLQCKCKDTCANKCAYEEDLVD